MNHVGFFSHGHHQGSPEVKFHAVHHGSHSHPHKEKLKDVHYKATTLTPPVIENHKGPYGDELKKHHHNLAFTANGKNTGHNHIHKAHPYKAEEFQNDELLAKTGGIKIPIAANGGEVNVYPIMSNDRENNEKHEALPPQRIESKPEQDDRHARFRETASMADVYFLGK